MAERNVSAETRSAAGGGEARGKGAAVISGGPVGVSAVQPAPFPDQSLEVSTRLSDDEEASE